MDQSIMDSENMPTMMNDIRPMRCHSSYRYSRQASQKASQMNFQIKCQHSTQAPFRRSYNIRRPPRKFRSAPPRRRVNKALYPFGVFDLAVFEPW